MVLSIGAKTEPRTSGSFLLSERGMGRLKSRGLISVGRFPVYGVLEGS